METGIRGAEGSRTEIADEARNRPTPDQAVALGMACFGRRPYPRMDARAWLGRRRTRSMACWLKQKFGCFHRPANDHAPSGEVDFKCKQHLSPPSRQTFPPIFTRRSLPVEILGTRIWLIQE